MSNNFAIVISLSSFSQIVFPVSTSTSTILSNRYSLYSAISDSRTISTHSMSPRNPFEAAKFFNHIQPTIIVCIVCTAGYTMLDMNLYITHGYQMLTFTPGYHFLQNFVNEIRKFRLLGLQFFLLLLWIIFCTDSFSSTVLVIYVFSKPYSNVYKLLDVRSSSSNVSHQMKIHQMRDFSECILMIS